MALFPNLSTPKQQTMHCAAQRRDVCPCPALAGLPLLGCTPHTLPPSSTGLQADALHSGASPGPPSKPARAKALVTLGSARGWGSSCRCYMCRSHSLREPSFRGTEQRGKVRQCWLPPALSSPQRHQNFPEAAMDLASPSD